MNFTLRSAVETDFAGIVAILNADRTEPLTVDDFRKQERNRPKDSPRLQVVACDPDGAIAGYGESRTGIGQKPGHFFIWVKVHPVARGQGAARLAYDALENWAVAQGAAMLESVVKDQDTPSQQWAQRCGYSQHYHLFQSRLRLEAWDSSPFASAIEKAVADGIRFSTLKAETTGEDTYRRYYDFRFRLGRDIPDVAGRALPPYEQWRESLARDPQWDPDGVFLAIAKDRWVAVSHLSGRPGHALSNSFTGVERDCRGRGLALAVKVKALEYARRLGTPYVTTSNHSVNTAMISVNQRLGYLPFDGIYTLCKSVRVEPRA